jgi:23S rRNA (guanosine2251-2'-O)-methyltransferase
MIISGKHEIEEAIQNEKPILKVITPKNYHLSNRLYQLFRDERIPVIQLQKSVFQKKYPDMDSIIALCDDVSLFSLEEAVAVEPGKYSRVLLMEEIEDPQNAGAMLRSAACFGFQSVCMTKHHSTLLGKGAMSASSGGIFQCKVARIHNIGHAIEYLKSIGYWIVGTDIRGNEEPKKINYNSHIAVIMGNEKNGLKKKTIEKCDHIVRIPISGKTNSLNVSVAFGIIGYEIFTQEID